MRDAFVGIDVAISRTKRLPIVIAVRKGSDLVPLPLAQRPERPPHGMGNRGILEPGAARHYAQQAVAYVQEVAKAEGLRVVRVAIDAPSDYCSPRRSCRQAEAALGGAGISYFKTPTRSRFAEITTLAQAHLRRGRPASQMPHANKLWMLAGFELFRAFGRLAECREVYPQAIACALGCAGRHKAQDHAWLTQLKAASVLTGWPNRNHARSTLHIAWGNSHDRVDAYLAAWVASLPTRALKPFGAPPDDVIWNPKVSLGSRHRPDQQN